MSNVETAIEEMIQTYIDENDYVCRLDAEQYTDTAIGEVEDEIAVLEQRIEYLEKQIAPAAVIEEPRAEGEKPRPVNQIDWIMTTHGLVAGYDSKELLLSYVQSVLVTPGDQSHHAESVIAMVLTTARNLINKKLEAEA